MFLNFIMNLHTNIMSFCVKLCELLYLPMGTHTYDFLLNMEHDILLSIIDCYCVFIVHLCIDIKIYRYIDILI